MNYSSIHFDLLLAHMLKDASILHPACTKLESAHLKSVGASIPQCVAFVVISRHFAKYACAPDVAALRACISAEFAAVNAFCDASVQATMDAWVAEFIGLVPVVDHKSTGMAKDIIIDIHRQCVYEPLAKNIMEQAQMSGELTAVAAELAKLETEHNSVKGAEHIFAEVSLGEQAALMRIRTGVDFIDKPFGEGEGLAGPGVCAIIAAQNSGKSTLGYQIVINCAMQSQHSILVLAENGWADRGIQINMLAAATGIGSKILERAKSVREAAATAGLDPDVCAKRELAMKTFVHILDLAKSGGGLDELDAKLTTLQHQGITPVCSYVDWAGIIAERMVSGGGNGGRKFKDTREALTTLASELVQIADRHNTFLFVAQQMDTVTAQKGRFGHYTMYCAAENRMFTAPFKYVMVLTAPGRPTDKYNDVQILTWVKARSDANRVQTLLRRTGDRCTFEPVTNLVQKGKRFISVSESADTAIPSEKRNSTGTE